MARRSSQKEGRVALAVLETQPVHFRTMKHTLAQSMRIAEGITDEQWVEAIGLVYAEALASGFLTTDDLVNGSESLVAEKLENMWKAKGSN
jgi:hypothetical protein